MSQRTGFDTVFVGVRAHGTGMAATGGKCASMGFSAIHENALLHQVFTLLRSQKGVEFAFAEN
ncbi:hypothetical protein [Desulforhabdus amnigena]|jgi:hypothetical protein|uniref:hypothetical protein n=1 Tax=Desulforhabdus amnigena TaxID=40218 RepID=UPI0016A77C96|nr:hypothetical protein [Desulforhabdus amnigena]NLJ28713.1 hypothetical protein [Deltaproteobacteria bacterium]